MGPIWMLVFETNKGVASSAFDFLILKPRPENVCTGGPFELVNDTVKYFFFSKFV